MILILAKYAPILITGLALFLAIITHYILTKKFWQPCFIAAILSTVCGYFLILFLPISFPENVISASDLAKSMIYFTFGSSLVLAIIVGYMMKLMPSLLK